MEQGVPLIKGLFAQREKSVKTERETTSPYESANREFLGWKIRHGEL